MLAFRRSDGEGDVAGLIRAYQPRIRAFIRTLLPSDEEVEDVLQETNVVLWKKAHEYELGTSFRAWSFRVAQFQVMALRQKQVRRARLFKEHVMESLIEEQARWQGEADERLERRKQRLRRCVRGLSPKSQRAVRERYFEKQSVKTVAKSLEMKANTLSQLLFRVRLELQRCLEGVETKV